jgi:hypothetical protein
MANYGGDTPNASSYLKKFNYGTPINLWKQYTYTPNINTTVNVLTPSTDKYDNIYIRGDLYVDGAIINPSDRYLKNNIESIDDATTNKIMNLLPTQFTLKNDNTHQVHYGFIAQEFENEYPELITIKPDAKFSNIKGINYLEIIPLLVNKIQMMQKEIDELKARI